MASSPYFTGPLYIRMSEDLHLGGMSELTKGVHVHRGKGAKDRYIPLPTSTLQLLRQYWVTHRHPRWLFPADGRDHQLLNKKAAREVTTPMSHTAVQGAGPASPLLATLPLR